MNQSLFNWINQFADQIPFLDWFMITSSEYAVWVMIALLVIVWFLGDPSKQRIVFYACVASIVALVLAKWGYHQRSVIQDLLWKGLCISWLPMYLILLFQVNMLPLYLLYRLLHSLLDVASGHG